MALTIVADENIARVKEAFASLGDVRALREAELTPAAVRDADLLLVRSTVAVGPALLDGSRVRFVGTATAGVDHLDTAWLKSRGIAFADAAGCNANAVTEWFIQSLLLACERLGEKSAGLKVGIVGVGCVGSRVARVLTSLGITPLLCDPPRAHAEGRGDFVSLDELLPQVDVVTLHTPLIRTGPHATAGLLNGPRLSRMKNGSLLVNAARGEIVDEAALLTMLDNGHLGGALLDTWSREPDPDPALIRSALIATPHIAGHSLDGKLAGTEMIYQAACKFAGVTPTWSARSSDVKGGLPQLSSPRLAALDEDDALILQTLGASYNLLEDDAFMRTLATLPRTDRANAFRHYRASYPPRRELRGLEVRVPASRPRVADVLSSLGASVISSPNK